ncbi:MAG: homocysteine S-methyltransferase, partial [Acidimicrobiaceae bacterium]|nr:homocysteine S-methyltransferase [Acidimicrobiaceae bacterium]
TGSDDLRPHTRRGATVRRHRGREGRTGQPRQAGHPCAAHLALRYPHIDVWGGCCGTWETHLDQIALNVQQARTRPLSERSPRGARRFEALAGRTSHRRDCPPRRRFGSARHLQRRRQKLMAALSDFGRLAGDRLIQGVGVGAVDRARRRAALGRLAPGPPRSHDHAGSWYDTFPLTSGRSHVRDEPGCRPNREDPRRQAANEQDYRPTTGANGC